MFFLPRRRPLLGAAMIGGAGYMAGRAGQQERYREADQDERLQELESERGAPAPATPAPASGGGDDLVSKLQQLSDLAKSGVLSQEEFETAKKKLLAG